MMGKYSKHNIVETTTLTSSLVSIGWCDHTFSYDSWWLLVAIQRNIYDKWIFHSCIWKLKLSRMVQSSLVTLIYGRYKKVRNFPKIFFQFLFSSSEKKKCFVVTLRVSNRVRECVQACATSERGLESAQSWLG